MQIFLKNETSEDSQGSNQETFAILTTLIASVSAIGAGVLGSYLTSRNTKEFEKQRSEGEPFPTEPLIMALLLSQDKMIDYLTKQISKYQSPVNNNEVIKKSEEEEPVLVREYIRDYIRKNDGRIHYIDD